MQTKDSCLHLPNNIFLWYMVRAYCLLGFIASSRALIHNSWWRYRVLVVCKNARKVHLISNWMTKMGAVASADKPITSNRNDPSPVTWSTRSQFSDDRAGIGCKIGQCGGQACKTYRDGGSGSLNHPQKTLIPPRQKLKGPKRWQLHTSWAQLCWQNKAATPISKT